MKASVYIALFVLLLTISCTSSIYTGVEYDDLYYLSSDRPAVTLQKPANNKIAENTLRADEYYDNVYAQDTLISEEYYDAVQGNENYSDAKSGYFDYYDDYSYSGRLRRFHGNYFYPYWRDPFYFNFGYPYSYGFGYYNNPYFYDPFMYDPFYYSYSSPWGYYGSYYNSWYYGFSPWYSSGYYSPYYSSYAWSPYYSAIRFNDNGSIAYGRRDRQSTSSTSWNRNTPLNASQRRDSYVSKGSTDLTRRTAAEASSSLSDGRRTVPGTPASRQASDASVAKSSASPGGTENARTINRTNTTSTSRPEYGTVNRSYTPSYNNPVMSTRPSYNNSRVNSSGSPSNQGSQVIRSNTSRTPSQGASYNQGRSSAPSGSSSSYSVPARRSVESGSGYSSGSFSNRSSSVSSYSSAPSSRSESYSSGSSGGSYSGGGSSGGSSGGASGGSSGSSGRR